MTKPIEKMTLRERLEEMESIIENDGWPFSHQNLNRFRQLCSDLPPDGPWIPGPPDVPDRDCSKEVRWLVESGKPGYPTQVFIGSDFGVRNALNDGYTIFRHQPYSPPGESAPKTPPCPPVGTPLLLRHKKSGVVLVGKILGNGLVTYLGRIGVSMTEWWTGVIEDFEVRELKWDETE